MPEKKKRKTAEVRGVSLVKIQ